MVRAVALTALALCLATPALAQERPVIQYPPAAGGGTPTPTPACDMSTTTYETVGERVSVPSAGVANNESSFTTVGTTVAELSGFWIYASVGTTAYRALVDVNIGGSNETVKVSDWGVTGQGVTKIFMPLNVPAGQVMAIRYRLSSTGSILFTIVGQRRVAGCPAGYTAVEALNSDITTARGGNTDVPLTNAWTELVPSTSRAYAGLLSGASFSPASNPATTQTLTYAVGVGASGSETQLAVGSAYAQTVSPYLSAAGGYTLMGNIASGSRLSGRVTAATPGTDVIRVQVMGIY